MHAMWDALVPITSNACICSPRLPLQFVCEQLPLESLGLEKGAMEAVRRLRCWLELF